MSFRDTKFKPQTRLHFILKITFQGDSSQNSAAYYLHCAIFLLILIFTRKKIYLSHLYSLINYLYFKTHVMDYYLNNLFQ